MIINTLWTNLLIQAVGLIAAVLTARILGPTGRGELALVLLYPQLVAGIALLGVDRAIAILVGRGELVRPVFAIAKLTLLLSLPAMIAGYVTVNWRVADDHLAWLSIAYLAYIPPVYFFTLSVFLFNGIGDFNRFNRVRIGFYLFNFASLIGIWLVRPSIALNWVVLANLVSSYVGFALAIWLLRNFKWPEGSLATVNKKGDLVAVFGVAIAFVIPVALAHFSSSAYQIILEQKSGVASLGLFVVIYSYSRLLSPMGNAISSHVFHLGIAGSGRDIANTFRLSLIVYGLSTLPLWLIAEWLIPSIFGPEFIVDEIAVGLLLCSCIFALSANSMAEFMNGRRKVGADTGGSVVYLITLAALGLWLVPTYGHVGMASAMFIADLFRCGFLVSRVSRETERALSAFWLLKWSDFIELVLVAKTVISGVRLWSR